MTSTERSKHFSPLDRYLPTSKWLLSLKFFFFFKFSKTLFFYHFEISTPQMLLFGPYQTQDRREPRLGKDENKKKCRGKIQNFQKKLPSSGIARYGTSS